MVAEEIYWTFYYLTFQNCYFLISKQGQVVRGVATTARYLASSHVYDKRYQRGGRLHRLIVP